MREIRYLIIFHNKTKSFNSIILQIVWYIKNMLYLCSVIKIKKSITKKLSKMKTNKEINNPIAKVCPNGLIKVYNRDGSRNMIQPLYFNSPQLLERLKDSHTIIYSY